MANSPEIKDTKKTNLSALYAVRALGGGIDMAIVQAEAAMDAEDVEDVVKRFADWEKQQKNAK
ncbi:MAG: hypothetical protein FWG45_02725 [Oscillospiraceae bacterium]|nr:hypothetical protein [Oscillospiraceae bacterium]